MNSLDLCSCTYSKADESVVLNTISLKVGKNDPPPSYELCTKDDTPSVSKDSISSEGAERGTWDKPIQFFFTCVGYAVGLGNVWRFPYLCFKNGGGAFLIPYGISLFFVGIPYFFMEISLGQYGGLGPLAIWKVQPVFKGIGYANIIIGSYMCIYYNIIVTYSLHYFLSSLRSVLPWADCSNPWNTCACRTNIVENNFSSFINSVAVPSLEDFEGLFNDTKPQCRPNITELYTEIGRVWDTDKAWINSHLHHMFNHTYLKTPSEEYFFNRVLKITSGIDETGGIQWELAVCLFISWTIIFLVLIRGIQSMGKVVYFTSIFPYILLTALVIRGISLEGAMNGIYFYLKPDISKLSDPNVWKDAAVQILFSLCACSGGLIAMSSYNHFNHNTLRDAFIVPLINCFTSLYAGFATFSVLGFMAHKKGVSVDKVVAGGPGLAFIVYPEGISRMPLPPVWSALFFLMMLTLGLSTMFSGTELVFTALIDDYASVLRKKRASILFRFGLSVVYFLVGLSMVTHGGHYLLNIFDSFIGGFPILFIGIMEPIAINWFYGYKRFADDIKMMLGRKPFFLFRACWCFIAPVAVIGIFGTSIWQYKDPTLGSYVYPRWAYDLGWAIVVTGTGSVPCYFVYYCLKLYKKNRSSIKDFLFQICEPSSDWGPSPTSRTLTKRKSSADISSHGKDNTAFNS